MKILFIYWAICYMITLIDWGIHWEEREKNLIYPMLENNPIAVELWEKFKLIIFILCLAVLAAILVPIKILSWIKKL